MKLIALIFFSFISTVTIKAQYHDSLQLYKHSLSAYNYKKLFFQYHDIAVNNYYDNSVLKIPEPALTYKTNTNGFDIYQSTPDNMYLIKPDSTVAFNMPVKTFTIDMIREK